jgi:hypothetical protein
LDRTGETIAALERLDRLRREKKEQNAPEQEERTFW